MSEPNSKILSVNNLRVDFWTNNGTVKAVRGISFDLYRGRTLAIVGESGSGKSVTSKAIMGLLAPNKIVQEGEILYDGRDILRLSEEELCKIRGSKIAMIFQDPMSSLNPIIKVGKQVTEAMMLQKKAEIRENKALVRYINGRFLKTDPSSKAMLQSQDLEALKPVAAKLCEENFIAVQEGLSALHDFLSHLLDEDPAFAGEGEDYRLIKRHFRELKRKLEAAKDRLKETKDDTIFTFFSSFSYFLEAYKAAMKREKAAEKRRRKMEKKGLNVNEYSIKERAFGSEIDTSSTAIFKKAKAYTQGFLDYLDKIQGYPRPNFEEEGRILIDYYARSVEKANGKIVKKEFVEKAIKLLGEVGIAEPEKRIKQYPFEFSGGMRQRIVIAIALSSNPEILICDEPTTALDVTIQAQILDLINELKAKRNLSIIFVTHNLGVVANMADDIAIMYAGKVVEYGTADDIFYDPRHPYTWALLASMPDLETKHRLDAIPGTPPNMIIPPKGDAFAARNKYALKIDFDMQPPLFKVTDTHYAATWLLDPRAPKVEMPETVSERIERFAALNAQNAEAAKEESVKDEPVLEEPVQEEPKAEKKPAKGAKKTEKKAKTEPKEEPVSEEATPEEVKEGGKDHE